MDTAGVSSSFSKYKSVQKVTQSHWRDGRDLTQRETKPPQWQESGKIRSFQWDKEEECSALRSEDSKMKCY